MQQKVHITRRHPVSNMHAGPCMLAAPHAGLPCLHWQVQAGVGRCRCGLHTRRAVYAQTHIVRTYYMRTAYILHTQILHARTKYSHARHLSTFDIIHVPNVQFTVTGVHSHGTENKCYISARKVATPSIRYQIHVHLLHL